MGGTGLPVPQFPPGNLGQDADCPCREHRVPPTAYLRLLGDTLMAKRASTEADAPYLPLLRSARSAGSLAISARYAAPRRELGPWPCQHRCTSDGHSNMPGRDRLRPSRHSRQVVPPPATVLEAYAARRVTSVMIMADYIKRPLTRTAAQRMPQKAEAP